MRRSFMNRQVVAFLSLFSLVLVLSIYYVMIPFANVNSNNSSLISTNVNGGTIVNGTESYFASLELERDSNHQDIIKEQEAIIASSEYTNEEKQVALETIEQEKEMMKHEEDIKDLVKSIGYPICFVEVKKERIYVLAYKIEPSSADAATIIYTVQDYLDAEKDVIVSFKSE